MASCISSSEVTSNDVTSPPPSGSDESWIHPSAYEFYTTVLIPSGAMRITKRMKTIRYGINRSWKVRRNCHAAQFLEFGVFEGRDICRIAAYIRKKERESTHWTSNVLVHGFDSFRGLPEAWDNGQRHDGPDEALVFDVGAFDLGGVVPDIPTLWKELGLGAQTEGDEENNIELHAGWFEDTVPSFFNEHTTPIAFIHADADLCGSTLCFLEEICRRRLLVKGSVILFDEFTNYENWQEGEFLAWMTIVKKYGLEFQYLCFHAPSKREQNVGGYGYQSVGIEITSTGSM